MPPPRDDLHLKRLADAVDAARQHFARDACAAATDEPTRHFADQTMRTFEALTLAIRSYRYAKSFAAPGGEADRDADRAADA